MPAARQTPFLSKKITPGGVIQFLPKGDFAKLLLKRGDVPADGPVDFTGAAAAVILGDIIQFGGDGAA